MRFHSASLLLILFQVADSQPVSIAPFGIAPPVTMPPATSSPGTASPGTDSPGTDSPGTATPETPVPETPVPETPVPETPVPETPVPETPAPVTPAPKTQAPEPPAPVAASSAPSSSPSGSHLPTGTNMPTAAIEVLPPDKQPRTDRRCGVTELDARGNCKKVCMENTDCEVDGEFCQATFLNYCHIMPEGHPQATDLNAGEQTLRRCGFEEVSARGYCGLACEDETVCPENEKCFPVQPNFCEHFKEQDESATRGRGLRQLQAGQDGMLTNSEYFDMAKEVIAPFFAAAETPTGASPTMAPAISPTNAPPTTSPPTFAPLPPSSAVKTSFMLATVLAVAVSLL